MEMDISLSRVAPLPLTRKVTLSPSATVRFTVLISTVSSAEGEREREIY